MKQEPTLRIRVYKCSCGFDYEDNFTKKLSCYRKCPKCKTKFKKSVYITTEYTPDEETK